MAWVDDEAAARLQRGRQPEVEMRKVMMREEFGGQVVFVHQPVTVADMADQLWNLGCELCIEAEPNFYNVSVRDNDEAKTVMLVSQISAIDNMALGRIGKVIGEAWMHKFGGKPKGEGK